MKLSTAWGALQIRGQIWEPIDTLASKGIHSHPPSRNSWLLLRLETLKSIVPVR